MATNPKAQPSEVEHQDSPKVTDQAKNEDITYSPPSFVVAESIDSFTGSKKYGKEAFGAHKMAGGGVGVGGLEITGKGNSASRRIAVAATDRAMPPVVSRKLSGHASNQYHSSVASSTKRSSIHGRIDWSSK